MMGELCKRGTPVLVMFSLLWSLPTFARKKGSIAETVMDAAKAALVTIPKDGEVCFSPDELCDIKLLKFIESAQKSIDIAIYDFTLDELVHQILVRAKKISVRIVVDRRQARERNSLVPTLVKAGANIRYGYQRGIMHNKFTIIDGKRVETGSFNYTNHAARANNENQVYLGDPNVVTRYKSRFEEIWSKAKPISSLRKVSGQ